MGHFIVVYRYGGKLFARLVEAWTAVDAVQEVADEVRAPVAVAWVGSEADVPLRPVRQELVVRGGQRLSKLS